MNPVLQAIRERRSVRSFKPDPVPADLLDQVVEAGLYAASGMGRQSSKILVVTEKPLRDQIAEVNRRIGGWDEGFDPFYGAPAILIPLADKSCVTGVYDATLVMGNLMLAAHSLGLGSIWIHRAKEEFERPEFKALLRSLGVEGDWEGVGHCALGYAAQPLPQPPPRKPGRVVRADSASL